MGERKRKFKKVKEKVVEIVPGAINGPVRKLFVDVLDGKAPKKLTGSNLWLREAFLNPRALYQSRNEILALSDYLDEKGAEEGESIRYDDPLFQGMRVQNLEYAQKILELGCLSPISWLLKASPQILNNICFNFSTFKEREEKIFLVSENLKNELEDQDRDIEIKNILKEQTYYFEFLKGETLLYGTKDRIKSVFFSIKKEIDSFFREEKTFLNVVAFCEGENKEMKIFSLSPIEISLFKMFSEIIDHEVGNQNQYVSLSVNDSKNAKIIESKSFLDLLPARDYKKRSLLKLCLNLLAYIKSNEEDIVFKENPKPVGGKKKREHAGNNQTERRFCKLSLDEKKDIVLIDKMMEKTQKRAHGLTYQRNGGTNSLRRFEEISESGLIRKFTIKNKKIID